MSRMGTGIGSKRKYFSANLNSAILLTLLPLVGKNFCGSVETIKTAKDKRLFVNP